jgi:hypothetical protein
MSAKADADAVFTKLSTPRGRSKTNKQGRAIAVATAKPEIPPNQVAADNPIVAVVSDQSGISIDTAEKALCSSRIPRTTATVTTPAKIARSKASANQISATSESETAIEGNNLRPARLLIASLIECRSDIFLFDELLDF